MGKKSKPEGEGALKIEYVPLDQLQRAKHNPKSHDIEEMKSSFRRFGFVMPGGINEETGAMFAGHGRAEALEAMKAAGEPPPARIVVDELGQWLVPILRGVSFASEAEAEAYLVADNRLTEIGGWVEAALAESLTRIKEATDSLVGTGYKEEDIQALLAFGGTGEGSGGGEGLPELPDYQPPPQQPRLLIICDDQEQVARLREHLGIESVEGRVSFKFEDCHLPDQE